VTDKPCIVTFDGPNDKNMKESKLDIMLRKVAGKSLQGVATLAVAVAVPIEDGAVSGDDEPSYNFNIKIHNMTVIDAVDIYGPSIIQAASVAIPSSIMSRMKPLAIGKSSTTVTTAGSKPVGTKSMFGGMETKTTGNYMGAN